MFYWLFENTLYVDLIPPPLYLPKSIPTSHYILLQTSVLTFFPLNPQSPFTLGAPNNPGACDHPLECDWAIRDHILKENWLHGKKISWKRILKLMDLLPMSETYVNLQICVAEIRIRKKMRVCKDKVTLPYSGTSHTQKTTHRHMYT